MTYTCNEFDGVYLGGCAGVEASSPEEAAILLATKLDEDGLRQKTPVTPEMMKPFPELDGKVRILWNGDY